MVSLTLLREANEHQRFERLRGDDKRTALSPEAAEALAAELQRKIRGEVRFDPGSRALYATDGSNYRQVPIGVVIPREIEDVEKTVALAHKHRAPVCPVAAAPVLAGSAVTSPLS
jgi:FAD/FMN-containing dehydrogenase